MDYGSHYFTIARVTVADASRCNKYQKNLITVLIIFRRRQQIEKESTPSEDDIFGKDEFQLVENSNSCATSSTEHQAQLSAQNLLANQVQMMNLQENQQTKQLAIEIPDFSQCDQYGLPGQYTQSSPYEPQLFSHNLVQPEINNFLDHSQLNQQQNQLETQIPGVTLYGQYNQLNSAVQVFQPVAQSNSDSLLSTYLEAERTMHRIRQQMVQSYGLQAIYDGFANITSSNSYNAVPQIPGHHVYMQSPSYQPTLGTSQMFNMIPSSYHPTMDRPQMFNMIPYMNMDSSYQHTMDTTQMFNMIPDM